jgi:hypothetical protein
MNRTFRTLTVSFLGVGAAVLAVACSSGNNPGNYGDACTIYSVGAPCTGDLSCRCIDQASVTAEGCFCTQSCTVDSNCPGKYDRCLLANDPSQNNVLPANFCFQFLPDGGQLP